MEKDIKFTELQYKSSNNNEQYTPKYAVDILLPYIYHLKDKIIWCPFDKKWSYFVRVLTDNGFKVVYSHIDDGQDFFEYVPEEFDVILSNPPYKNKRKFIERALSFNKPFCLLLPVNILTDSICNETFGKDIQLLIPQQRIEFVDLQCINRKQKISFKAVYFGYKFFEKQIIMLNKSDMNKKDIGEW